MNTIIFGTAGIPLTTPNPNTLNGILHLKTLDLDALELEFVKKVYLTEKTAPEVAQAAKESNISLSAHAPYYLNMNAAEPDKLARSRAFLFRAAQIASLSGARNLVFHAGYYLNSSPEDTFNTILSNVSIVSKKLEENGSIINLSPETSGKATQFGTLEEVLKLCTLLDGVTPCVDFAHLHAYSGEVNTYDEFVSILNRIKQVLGEEALDNLHMHVSGIHYGPKGELKHLLLDESDFNYPALVQALIDTNTGGVMICESPSIEDDALRLKATYFNLKAKS